MAIHDSIYKLRTNARLSQERFAELFHVSQQSVQKWENGDSTPELSKIIKICRYFGVSLDAFILGNDNRIVEELQGTKQIKPQYANMHDWEFYSANLLIEYQQSVEEGLDIEMYKDLFTAASKLPKNETAKKLGDLLFEIVSHAAAQSNYQYIEPSDLESIKALRKPYEYERKPAGDLKSKISGAWFGRICGCFLGKPIEGIRTDQLVPFLKATGNFPMHRYILGSDITEEIENTIYWNFSNRPLADTVVGMPVDDDTNYTVLYQELIEQYGKDFTPFDVSRIWLDLQSKSAYCTAERVAYCNFVKGFAPPDSAVYKNPYREWIGAQIRADYFGYINPGNPELAAEMAWRDASVSHIKNGIYGEMFVAAMLAVAAATDKIEDIVRGGLAQIPHTSRLYHCVTEVVDAYRNGASEQDCFQMIHRQFNEYSSHDWCHTIPNAMIVVAALLYGNRDFGRSVCMAVETGFDTDCNGATVGSILGMAIGIENIPDAWISPLADTLHTSIFGVGNVRISERIDLTMRHIWNTK